MARVRRIDKTGFCGTFDMHVDSRATRRSPGLLGVQFGPPELAADLSKPSIFTALQDRLGLKLESDIG